MDARQDNFLMIRRYATQAEVTPALITCNQLDDIGKKTSIQVKLDACCNGALDIA
jgi:hypothetical protein